MTRVFSRTFVVRAAVLSAGLATLGCGAPRGGPAAVDPSALSPSPLTALRNSGPDRFARVSPTLYRGGQPNTEDLENLRALGVTTIVALRQERLGQRRAEAAVARGLGLRFREYPFIGVLGADPKLVRRAVSAMVPADGTAAYVHCGDGSGRTSMVVAAYRVLVEGWDPHEAWEQEVVAYGHRTTALSRELALTYWDVVHEHQATRDATEHALTRRDEGQPSTSSIAD